MENATKALFMATSVFIGLLLLSLGVYMFKTFGDYGAQTTEKLAEKDINEFNAQFYKYEGQETCRAHNIVSVANLAKQNNQNYGYTEYDKNKKQPYYIQVKVKNIEENFEEKSQEYYNNFINQYSLIEGTTDIIYFECTKVTISQDTKRVIYIEFKKINK